MTWFYSLLIRGVESSRTFAIMNLFVSSPVIAMEDDAGESWAGT